MSETQTQTVTEVRILPPQSSPDPAVYGDYLTLATAFLIAGVAIFCMRRLGDIFLKDND